MTGSETADWMREESHMAAWTDVHAAGPCEIEGFGLKDMRRMVGTPDDYSDALGRLLPQHETFSKA